MPNHARISLQIKEKEQPHNRRTFHTALTKTFAAMRQPIK